MQLFRKLLIIFKQWFSSLFLFVGSVQLPQGRVTAKGSVLSQVAGWSWLWLFSWVELQVTHLLGIIHFFSTGCGAGKVSPNPQVTIVSESGSDRFLQKLGRQADQDRICDKGEQVGKVQSVSSQVSKQTRYQTKKADLLYPTEELNNPVGKKEENQGCILLEVIDMDQVCRGKLRAATPISGRCKADTHACI